MYTFILLFSQFSPAVQFLFKIMFWLASLLTVLYVFCTRDWLGRVEWHSQSRLSLLDVCLRNASCWLCERRNRSDAAVEPVACPSQQLLLCVFQVPLSNWICDIDRTF